MYAKMRILGAGLILSGCVSAGKFHKSEQDLAAAETRVAELEKKLGIESTAKSRLEGSVSEMKTALEEMSKRKSEAEKRIAEFQELTDKFKPLVDANKLRVQVVNGRMVVLLSTDVLFPSGSAKYSKDGVPAIREVAGVLKSIEGKKFQIEGHTDGDPIKTSMYANNWELASGRAMSVLKTMLEAGMSPERISAASFGEFRPIRPNDTKENKALNRRIEIVVVPDLTGLPGFDELQRVSKIQETVPAPVTAPSASLTGP
jgi:chemotaxis protein MotB